MGTWYDIPYHDWLCISSYLSYDNYWIAKGKDEGLAKIGFYYDSNPVKYWIMIVSTIPIPPIAISELYDKQSNYKKPEIIDFDPGNYFNWQHRIINNREYYYVVDDWSDYINYIHDTYDMFNSFEEAQSDADSKLSTWLDQSQPSTQTVPVKYKNLEASFDITVL